jgi:hypothetical protein
VFYGRDNYFNNNCHRGYNSFSFLHIPQMRFYTTLVGVRSISLA